MTSNDFLKNLLNSQNLSPQQEKDLASHKDEVTRFLRKEFGNTPSIRYAGSYEKGTMISDRYDLDIVCYFPSSDERSLKEIRQDVATHLSKEYLTRPKASAERILNLKGAAAPGDFHIDVVPGRFIHNTKDVFLHVQYGDKERMQTNLKTHIDYITGSGCVPIIRLVKLWAHRNQVTIKTFVLELFVVRALDGSSNKGSLKDGFIEVMESFRDEFGTVRLEDPANSNNVVSQLMSQPEKDAVAQAAQRTAGQISNSNELADWQAAFVETSGAAYSRSISGPTVITHPPKQWAQ